MQKHNFDYQTKENYESLRSRILSQKQIAFGWCLFNEDNTGAKRSWHVATIYLENVEDLEETAVARVDHVPRVGILAFHGPFSVPPTQDFGGWPVCKKCAINYPL